MSDPAHAPSDPHAAIRRSNAAIRRIVSPDGIDEARYVELGGARQWITIRGQDRRQPILLYLHGGPGGAISDISYVFQRPWEDYFTVVQWDQRGFGRSAIDGARLEGTITLDQYAADLIELTEFLCRELGQPKIIPLGSSFGTILALELAHRRPDLVHAAAAFGLLVDQRRNFEETRRLLTEAARAGDDAAFADMLDALGPLPPGRDREAWVAWVGTVQNAMVERGYSWRNMTGPDDTWDTRIGPIRDVSPSLAEPPPPPDPPFTCGPVTPFDEIQHSIADWSAADSIGYDYQVPIIGITGAHDWQTPVTLAREYMARVRAPYKRLIEFPHSAHAVVLEEPGRMVVTLVDEVLPFALGRSPVDRRL